MVFLDGIIYSLQKIGGISIYFDAIVRKLNEENINCSLLLFNNEKKFDFPLSINIERKKIRILERYRGAKLNEASVFHSSYYRNPENKKIPVILTVHDLVYEKFMIGYKKELHIAQKSLAIQRAEIIICVSNSTKNDLLDLYEVKNKNIVVIPNGVSDTFKPINTDVNRSYVLYVGSRVSYKNFQVALRVIEHIRDIELWVIGAKISDSELKFLSEESRKRVVCKGYVSEITLNEIYNNAICLLYPSFYEGFGIPVLEAFRARCPVVIGNCTALLEFGEKNLYVCKTNNIDEYVEAVKLIIKKNRNQITISGYLESKKYSWDKSALAHVDLYKYFL
jgi:mannosyltransferase